MSRKFMSLRREILQRGLVSTRSTDEYSEMLLNIPVPKEKIIRCASRRISPAHAGNLKNSIDFHVPEGTEVYAVADGVVFEIKNNSRAGGPSVRHWADGNYVEIKHGREFTRYEHLMYGGIIVKKGQKLRTGQLIGYSGNTGLSEVPHLHFELCRAFGNGPDDYVTLKARFRNFPDIYKKKSM